MQGGVEGGGGSKCTYDIVFTYLLLTCLDFL